MVKMGNGREALKKKNGQTWDIVATPPTPLSWDAYEKNHKKI